MCGIAGGWTADPSVGSALEPALDCIRHRGPDGAGVLRDGSVFLGMRRLAIIDIEGGDQPVYGEQRRVAVVFNGEIYNYRELRNRLADSHSLLTSSDTETLVHLYEERGPEMCDELQGMFAFAIWDRGKRELFIARDRFGKKPLYYQRTPDGGLIFASELKALEPLARAAGLSWRLKQQSLYDYLSFGYVPQPDTIYEGVYALPAASTLLFDGRDVSIKRYWSLGGRPALTVGYDEALELTRAALRRAVDLRLRSDVPLGVFLSGGVDSTVIAYEASRQLGSSLETFTVAMQDDKLRDESAVAVRTAEFLGVRNTVLPLEISPLQDLQRMVAAYDQPYSDSSAIPTMAISRLARQHVTVVLTGDGGDEMFVGYRRYLAARHLSRWRLPVGRLASALTPFASERRSPLGFAQRYLRLLAAGRGARYLIATSDMLTEGDKRMIWRGGEVIPTESRIEERLPSTLHGADLQLAADVEFNLQSDLLVKMDIAAMAASLEARSPFLDSEVAELCSSLSVAQRTRGRRLKGLLKDAYRGRVPGEVLDLPKRGFEVPLERWLANDFRPLIHDCLLATDSHLAEFVDSKYLREIASGRVRTDRNRSYLLFALLVAEVWLRNRQ